jgi:hypothetical protein
MFLAKHKKVLFLMIALLGIGSYGHAEAFNFQMELVASVPHPSNPQETLSSKVILGTEDRATDGFDTAWDVVAIPGGMIQVYIDHPEYDNATRILWQDTQSSAGLPKQWDLQTLPAQSGASVTLHWSATGLSDLPPTTRIRFVDLDGNNQELDMRSVFTYSYVHTDQTVPHRFQVVADEAPVVTPPPQPPPPAILTDHLPVGHLRKHYTAQLEAQGIVAPYRWKIISGRLPTGLKLNHATGVISGKPRRIGQYRFTVQLTDANGLTLRKAFTLSIMLR